MNEHLDLLRREFQQYQDCLQRIGDLADWFFYGHHMYTEPHHWPAL